MQRMYFIVMNSITHAVRIRPGTHRHGAQTAHLPGFVGLYYSGVPPGVDQLTHQEEIILKGQIVRFLNEINLRWFEMVVIKVNLAKLLVVT